MTLTLNENGIAISETQDNVTMPIDCSFEMVNDWIHGIDVHFEEVQALCLGMATENDRLRKALSDIKRHQEIIAGPQFSRMGSTWQIANKALEKDR